MEHVHFIGIAGVGMSGLAQVLLARGLRVSGSDPQRNAATERLADQGATVYPGQAAENIERERPDLVIVTAAVHAGNPELDAARVAGIPELSRAELLGRVMAEHAGPRIAVAGTHGKTTTTAMLASVLIEGGLDPTVLVGGEYAPIGGNVRIGRGPAFLAEACEAYDSFLQLHPDIAVLTNIEADHLDYFRTEDRVFESFGRFVRQTARGGALVLNGADTGTSELRDERLGPDDGPARRVEFADAPGREPCVWCSSLALEGPGSTFTVHRGDPGGPGEALGEMRLQVPGRHNVSNALAAVAVGLEVGIPFERIAAALAGFRGAGRRFETLADASGIRVIDDYAHHPSEIQATLAAARGAYPDRRILVVFQPHLYSRTRDFMDRFAAELAAADGIVVAGIYAAREEPMPGVTSADLVRRIAAIAPEKMLLHVPDRADVPDALESIARSGDVVLTMGAGDVRSAGEEFAHALARREA